MISMNKLFPLALSASLILLPLTSCSRPSVKNDSHSSVSSSSTTSIANVAMNVNTESQQLTLVTVPYGVPKGETDCRINSIDQFNDGISYIITPDGRSAAYVGCQLDGKKFVFANGKLTQNLDEIWRPMFSADGKHLAFFMRKDSAWTLSLDGHETALETQPYGSFGETMTFTPDGQFVYIEKSDKGQALVIGGVKKDHYTEVSLPVFGGNNSMAYRAVTMVYSQAQAQRTSFVIFNDQKGKDYLLTSRPLLSPDGSNPAYVAVKSIDEKTQTAQCVIVIGGTEKPYDCDEQTLMKMAYDQPAPIVFSKDGTSIAYPVLLQKGEYTRGGEETVKPAKMGLSVNEKVVSDTYASSIPPVFNPVTNEIAYAEADSSGRVVIVYGGGKSRRFNNIGASYARLVTGSLGVSSTRSSLSFSPDGSKLIFIGTDAGDKDVLVVNNVEWPQYEEINDVTMSPDGKRFAYITRRLVPGNAESGEEQTIGQGGYFVSQYFAVIDGKEGTNYSSADFLTFSEDSRHYAYVGSKGFKTVINLDGVEQGEEFDAVIAPPVFTANGQLAFGAKKGKELWWVVTDIK